MTISGLFLQDYLNLEVTSEEALDDEVFEPQDPTVTRRIHHARRSDSQYNSMSSGNSITPPSVKSQRGLRQLTPNEEATDEEWSLSGSCENLRYGIGDSHVCQRLTFLDGGSMLAVSSQKSVDVADSDPDVEPELEALNTDSEDDIVSFPCLSPPGSVVYSCHGNSHGPMDTVTPENQYLEAVPNRGLVPTYHSPIGESYTRNGQVPSAYGFVHSSNTRDSSSHGRMDTVQVECERTQKFSPTAAGSISPRYNVVYTNVKVENV